MGGNGSCSCACPGISSEGLSEMAPLSAEEFANVQSSGSRICVASALSLTANVPAALEPVVLPADCNQITVSYVVTSATSTPAGTIYLMQAIDCGGTWVATASANFSGIGQAVISPPLTGVGTRCFKLIIIGQAGIIVICDICIWCTNA